MSVEAITSLVRAYSRGFTHSGGPRRVGREAEFHLVDDSGGPADAALVLEGLVRDREARGIVTRDGLVGVQLEGRAMMREVGRSTLELVLDPVETLHVANTAYEIAIDHLEARARAEGLTVVFTGLHPSAVPGHDGMTPKSRYGALASSLGEAWYWFTVTASDQTHVDVGSSEAAQVCAVLNRVTPVVWALCGNSHHQGPDARPPVPAHREKRLRELLDAQGRASRHGPLPEGLTDLQTYVEHIAGLELLVLDEESAHAPGRGTWLDWYAREAPTEDRARRVFAFHEHYVWPSARLRTGTGTIELRAACQQPRDEHLAAATLHLGLVEGWRHLQELSPHPGMHQRALDHGLDLPPEDLTVVETALTVCETALAHRGQGEEHFMEPLWKRFLQRENPGQRRQGTA